MGVAECWKEPITATRAAQPRMQLIRNASHFNDFTIVQESLGRKILHISALQPTLRTPTFRAISNDESPAFPLTPIQLLPTLKTAKNFR